MKPGIAAAAVSAALLFAAGAAAQTDPSRPVRVVVPLTAGSGADIAVRIAGRTLTEAWKQPVVVDNRPGAGGQIGTQLGCTAIRTATRCSRGRPRTPPIRRFSRSCRTMH